MTNMKIYNGEGFTSLLLGTSNIANGAITKEKLSQSLQDCLSRQALLSPAIVQSDKLYWWVHKTNGSTYLTLNTDPNMPSNSIVATFKAI